MAGTELKAIETVYNGYRFRSRLEARWAVFFGALRIPYEYEPEGFDLGGLWYLPDFRLPGGFVYWPSAGLDRAWETSGPAWVEIKPSGGIPHDAWERALRLSAADSPVAIMEDAPYCEARGGVLYAKYHGTLFQDGEFQAGRPCWQQCLVCDTIELTSDYGAAYYSCFMCRLHPGVRNPNRVARWGLGWDGARWRYGTQAASSWNTPMLSQAFRAARQARFEHGARSQ